MKNICPVILASLCACSAYAASSYHDEQHGFSITPPSQFGEASNMPVHLYLNPTDGFAPNVNVNIQKFDGDMAAYSKLSSDQFAQAQFKIIKSSIQGETAVFEYSGNMQGKDFHFYARAFKRSDMIYLATGTALESQWKKHSSAIMKSINSFSLKKPGHKD